jgi:predicted MPP superfamily phosphohydrolase
MSASDPNPSPRRLHARLASFAAASLAAIATLGSWAAWWEPASLRNEDHELALPGWPAACDGLRVAVLADLHVGSPWNGPDKLAEIVDLTLRARPDLVLLAGDYVIHGVPGGTFVPPEDAARTLASLAAPLGVHAVLGNHDWWLDAPRVRAALESAAISVLEDAARPLRRGACRFWLAGISDFWEGAHDAGAALRDVPEGEPVIAFTHNPDVFPEIPARVTLTIAGHTHGGQVYLPGVGRPVVPSAYGERYAIGHVEEAGRHLFVSSGLGTSIVPVRFLVPPEVSVLTLRSIGGP